MANKPLHPHKKSKMKRDNTKNATKNFDYTKIADWLRTISWSNSSDPTGVVKPVYERSTFHIGNIKLYVKFSTICTLTNNRFSHKFSIRFITDQVPWQPV